jgi:SpoIIAA-like
MPDKIEVNEESGIIQITSYGEITGEDLKNTRRIVSEIIRQTGFCKLLVDTTGLQCTIPVMTTFEHAYIISDENVFKTLKHAILVISSPVKRDLDLMVKIATNRGGSIKMFHTREEAFSWLNN